MKNPLNGIFLSLPRTVVVTGTDTDVGKTYATAALAVAGWYAGRRRIAVYKPQQTGMRGDDPGDVHDVARLARAAGVPSEALTIAEGQRLTEPMAPPPAAAIDGVELLPITAHVAKILWPAGTRGAAGSPSTSLSKPACAVTTRGTCTTSPGWPAPPASRQRRSPLRRGSG